jgi:XisH protein
MPAHDVFHGAVKKGLTNEGWIITDDPLYIEFGGVDM